MYVWIHVRVTKLMSGVCRADGEAPAVINQPWSQTLMFICLHFPALTAVSIHHSVCTQLIGAGLAAEHTLQSTAGNDGKMGR